MVTIFTDPAYDFVGRRRWAYAVSIALLVLGLGSIVVKGGLSFDIDFTGGMLLEVRLRQAMPIASVRARLATVGLEQIVIQEFGDPRDLLLRTHAMGMGAVELSQRVRTALDPQRSGAVEIRRVESVGPQVGRELRWRAFYTILAGLAGILLYIWLRFDFRGGVAAIVKVGYDVVICLGALSLTNREFSLSILAALLTVIGFSVNDTIVTYDRLWEIRSRTLDRGVTFAQQANRAVNQTLSRTVLTVAPVAMSAAMLFCFGGPSLENFAFVVVVGSITGTLATVYVAIAVVVDWTEWAGRGRQMAAGARVRVGRRVTRA